MEQKTYDIFATTIDFIISINFLVRVILIYIVHYWSILSYYVVKGFNNSFLNHLYETVMQTSMLAFADQRCLVYEALGESQENLVVFLYDYTYVKSSSSPYMH